MKRLISIGLLLVFLFNVVGYRVFFFYLEKAADLRLEARLNAISEFEDELIAVKIPIRLPYQTDWKDFERTDGEVMVNGTVLRYVKQKVYKDTLVLLCINFKEKSNLVKHRSEYVKQLNALTTDSSKKPTYKHTQADFYQEAEQVSFEIFASLQGRFAVAGEGHYPTGFTSKIKIPPRIVSFSIS